MLLLPFPDRLIQLGLLLRFLLIRFTLLFDYRHRLGRTRVQILRHRCQRKKEANTKESEQQNKAAVPST